MAKIGRNCPECGELLVYSGFETTTLVGYVSPRGHNHDDNCVERMYTCKNDHKIFVSKINTCPVCDWTGKKKCFCCGEKQEKWPDEE